MAHQVLHANTSTIKFSAHILQTYGAPKLAELTECSAPELPPWTNHTGNVILSAIFHGIDFGDDVRPSVLNLLRRAEFAVSEYGRGRSELLKYVEERPQRNNHFLTALRALSHFEQCIATTYQAVLLTVPMTKQSLFNSGDDSPLERLNKLYNRSKHFNEGGGQVSPPPATPVWLTNFGLECTECTLSFVELHEIIGELTKITDTIGNLPKLVEEKRRKMRSEQTS